MKTLGIAVLLVLLHFVPAYSLVGDVDNNGTIEINDAVLIFQVSAITPLPTTITLAADANNDNRIDLADGLYVLQKIAGIRNIAPELSPIGDKSVEEHDTLLIAVNGSDGDGDEIVLEATDLPEGAFFDPQTGDFSWKPYYDQAGFHYVTFHVTDSYGASDFETITITVIDKIPVFVATRDYPLRVGDWRSYKNATTGAVEQISITGERLIAGTYTKIMQFADGQRQYYTSRFDGVKLWGEYVNLPEYTGEVIYDAPIQAMPNNSQVGTTHVSTTSYTFWLYGYLFHVNATSTCRILGVEDVVTENSVLKDCLKASCQVNQYIVETGDTIVGTTVYSWFYEDIGMVKEVGEDNLTIFESYVDGIHQTY